MDAVAHGLLLVVRLLLVAGAGVAVLGGLFALDALGAVLVELLVLGADLVRPVLGLAAAAGTGVWAPSPSAAVPSSREGGGWGGRGRESP